MSSGSDYVPDDASPASDNAVVDIGDLMQDAEELLANIAGGEAELEQARKVKPRDSFLLAFGDLDARDPLPGIIGKTYVAHRVAVGVFSEARTLERLVDAGWTIVRSEELATVDYALVTGSRLWPGGVGETNMENRREWVLNGGGKNLILMDHKDIETTIAIGTRTTGKGQRSDFSTKYGLNLSKKQYDLVQVLTCSFSRQPEIHAAIPSNYFKAVSLKSSDHFSHYSAIPPFLQPWAFYANHIKEVGNRIQSAVQGTEYRNPQNNVSARRWQPILSADRTVLRE